MKQYFYFLHIFNSLLLVDTFSLGFKCSFCSYAYFRKLRYDFLGILFIVFLTKYFNSLKFSETKYTETLIKVINHNWFPELTGIHKLENL